MLERFDADSVRHWCHAALEALGEAREEIDALNVYPVPDGDTGTNLFLTMESAVAAEEATTGDDPAVIMRAIARGAMLGARGNSGIIVSQMLRGVADVLGTVKGEARSVDFAACLTRAADLGYESVAKPVEGTILTVARAAAAAATEVARRDGVTIGRVALHAARAAREALARTPEQLEVLRRNNVVDAGGRGLCVLLDALDVAITGRRALSRRRAIRAGEAAADLSIRPGGPAAGLDSGAPAAGLDFGGPAAGLDFGDEPGPAFEVMYLLDASEEAVHALRDTLATLGDSVAIVGGEGLWNIHVHVDDIGAAIEAGIAAGRPHRVKVTQLVEVDRRAPVRSTLHRAVVAFAAGPGLTSLFEEGGAVVVPSALGRRPSTAEVLAAIRRANAQEVIVLPNDGDGIAVAEAAAREARNEGVRVAVIPTRAQVQGLAAVAVHEPTHSFDADVVAMTAAAGHTRDGAVTVAVKDAVTSAGVCRPGDVLGVVDGDFAVIGTDLVDTAVEVVDRMLAAGGELVTLVVGEGDHNQLAEAVHEHVRFTRPEVDCVTSFGGQPRYPLLIGVE